MGRDLKTSDGREWSGVDWSWLKMRESNFTEWNGTAIVFSSIPEAGCDGRGRMGRGHHSTTKKERQNNNRKETGN